MQGNQYKMLRTRWILPIVVCVFVVDNVTCESCKPLLSASLSSGYERQESTLSCSVPPSCTNDVTTQILAVTWTNVNGGQCVYDTTTRTLDVSGSLENRVTAKKAGDVFELGIHETRLIDDGDWTCKVTLDTDISQESDVYKFEVKVKPASDEIIITIPEKGYVEAYKEEIFMCNITRVKPKTNIIWDTENENILASHMGLSGKYEIEQGVWSLYSTMKVTFGRKEPTVVAECALERPGDDNSVWVSRESKDIHVYYRPVTHVTLSSETTPVEGTSIQLLCHNDAAPKAIISPCVWKYNNADINPNEKYKVEDNGEVLVVSNLKHGQDDGTYTCGCANTVGFSRPKEMDGFILNVNYPPTVMIGPPSANSIIEGQDVTIPCNISDGYPTDAITVTFYKNNVPVDTENPHFSGCTPENPELVIHHVKMFDSGLYTCAIETVAGSGSSMELQLEVYYKPRGSPPVIKTTTDAIGIGRQITFSCKDSNLQRHRGYPRANETNFYQDGDLVHTTTSLSWTTAFTSVSYSGKYTCSRGNLVGHGRQSEEMEIQVIAPTSIEFPTAKLLLEPEFTKNISLSCTASGHNPSIIWLKDEAPVDDTHPLFKQTEIQISGSFSYGQTVAVQSTIMWTTSLLSDVHCGDVTKFNGVYNCESINEVNSVVRTDISEDFTISTRYAPISTHPVPIMEAGVIGKEAVLSCTVCANPKPIAYTWTRKGLPVSGESIAQKEDLLFISPVADEHYGEYTCHARNVIFDHAYDTAIEFGLVPQSKPHPPKDFTQSSSSSRSVTVNWKPGFDGGFKQAFALYYKRISDSDFTVWKDNITDFGAIGQTVSETVYGLAPNDKYEFKVKAVNANRNERERESEWAQTEGETKEPPKVHLLSVNWTSTTVEVTWEVRQGEPDWLVLQYSPVHNNTYKVLLNRIDPYTSPLVDTSSTSRDPNALYRYRMLVCEEGQGDHCAESNYLGGSGLTEGTIAGIVIGVIFVICMVILAAALLVRYRRRREIEYGPNDYKDDVQPYATTEELLNPGGYPGGSSSERRSPAVSRQTPEEIAALYATVDKTKKRQSSSDQSSVPVYAEVKKKPSPENGSNSHLDDEVPYANIGDSNGNMRPRKVEYVDLEFQKGKKKKKKVRGSKDKTHYASIDFSKTAQNTDDTAV